MKHFINKLSYFICTGFYSGLARKLPGTTGSLAYLILFLIAHQCLGPFAPRQLVLVALAVTLLGGLAVAWQLKLHRSESDPQHFVVDEWAGLALALCALPAESENLFFEASYLFVLFRFFDIVKPWPIRKLESLPGAVGIMLDDIAAGAFSIVLFFGSFRLAGL